MSGAEVYLHNISGYVCLFVQCSFTGALCRKCSLPQPTAVPLRKKGDVPGRSSALCAQTAGTGKPKVTKIKTVKTKTNHVIFKRVFPNLQHVKYSLDFNQMLLF